MPIMERSVAEFIAGLSGLDVVAAMNAQFFFYDPRGDIPHDRRQPFATIVTTDEHDAFSDLEARGLFRVNVGVTRETYRATFGPEPGWNTEGPVATGHDFTQVDAFLPHPVYAPLSWICIVGPTERSWPQLQEYLREAYAKAKRLHDRRRHDAEA